MGYHTLVDFMSFPLTKQFPITPAPIGMPSTSCIDKTVPGFSDVIPFQSLDFAIFVVYQLNITSFSAFGHSLETAYSVRLS